jgi:peptidyl-prolyl cis-trans isomerase C
MRLVSGRTGSARAGLRLAATAIVAAVSACTGGHGRPASQVVASVNGSEITVSQLNQALAEQSGGATTAPTSQHVLEGLIDEQLLVKQALDSELDRDPAVVQALEQARRQVLARAYAERMVFPREPISAAEQIEYYKEHPELFGKRRIYQVSAYTLHQGELPDGLRVEIAKARSADAIRGILSAHHVQFEDQTLTRAAEQLPLESLSSFAAANVGDMVIMPPHDGQVAVMLVTGINDSPIDLERAQPIIQQYLANVRNSRALEDHLKQARASAKITYAADSGASAERLASEAAPTQPTDGAHGSGAGAAAVN